MEGKINATVIIVGVIILFSSSLVGFGFTPSYNNPSSQITAELVNPTVTEKKNTLQIHSLGFKQISTLSPTSLPVVPTIKPEEPFIPLVTDPVTSLDCIHSGPVSSSENCCNGSPPFCSPNSNPFYPDCPDDLGLWCNAKPVIYLYPTYPMFVDVSLKVPGEVIVSNPLYPQEGWKNVFAYLNGTLWYKGKQYHELYYETSVIPIDSPKQGIVVPVDFLRITLENVTTRLGLLYHEREELLQYWLPRLEELQVSYIFVSFFDPASKDKIDHVDIFPKPDTFIQFIMYFRPLSSPIAVSPLVFPTVLERKGFTAVEWGGIIDYD